MNANKIYYYLVTEVLHLRMKPITLQFPITDKCNSRCTTCNIWKQKKQADVDVNELKDVLNDEYFSDIQYVGINGGEPFLHHNFIGVIHTLLSLPHLKALYIITNGLAFDRIVNSLQTAKAICREHHVKINLTISLDGIEERYGQVRGIPNGFRKVKQTITEIANHKEKYCDSLTLGTTISNRNVVYLSEIGCFSKVMHIPIHYHLAVPNRRIYTCDSNDYSVFNDPKDRMLATEFFFGKYKYENSWKNKLFYFQNFYYLLHKGTARISACSYKFQDLTLDENLNVYFCAKESYGIGNAVNNKIRNIVKSRTAKKEHKRIGRKCKECGHYITLPTLRGTILFIKETLKPGVWLFYKLMCRI